MKILETLKETNEYLIYIKVKELYDLIAEKQKSWYEKSQFFCPENCGECCRNFEPDLLESEAVFMAIWLLENQYEVAQKVKDGEFPFYRSSGCPFWNENSKFHCSIYGGRAFICRFFGASAFRSKNGDKVFKPCKFYPVEKLENRSPKIFHKEYREEEIKKCFGSIPLVMSDVMQRAVEIFPQNKETKLLRDILPQTIEKILWKQSLL